MSTEGTVPAVSLPYGYGHRWLTLEEVGAWMNVPESTLRGMVDRRSIPYRKIGQALRFPEAELEEWSCPDPKPGAGREIPIRLRVCASHTRTSSLGAPLPPSSPVSLMVIRQDCGPKASVTQLDRLWISDWIRKRDEREMQDHARH